MNWNEKTVLITGSKGFLGSFLVKELEKLCPKKIITPSSNELDLRDNSNCNKIVRGVDIVFHLAGSGGGIGFMRENPADVFYDNILMGTQLIHEAKEAKVKKFIALGTVCSYPKFASIPFSEEEIWNGYPEETNAPYGLAKKMMLVQLQAYRRQYQFPGVFLLPVNLYGPGDNFNPRSSHVIPALIRKLDAAIETRQREVVLWGDGSPTREFLHVRDAARGIVLATAHYSASDPVNLGAGMEISIADLASQLAEIMGYNGRVTWDVEKPNGQQRRMLDITKLYPSWNGQNCRNLPGI